MKKIISLLLAAVIILGTLPFAFAESVTPVIMVSGFGATTLSLGDDAVFPPSTDVLIDSLGIKGMNFEETKAYIAKWLEDEGYVEQLSKIVANIIEPIRTNPDGTSYYDTKPIVSGAENTSLAAFKANDMLDYVPYTGSEFLDMESVAERIGEENVFNFTYDWRVDYNVTSDELKEYIDDVLELTGAKKVSIYSISQGCMVVGQYLYKYAQLRQVDNIVFDTPVLGGTSFASDLLKIDEPVQLNYNIVLRLLSDILHIELDFTGLEPILHDDFFTDAVRIGRDDLILPPVKSCIAFWEMVPPEKFDYLAKLVLDEKENAEVITAVKKFYSGFVSNITGTFERAEKYGTTVSIKACTGFTLATTTDTYADSIVDMKYSCGAICAPYGETFPDDYKQAVNNGKNNISPDRTIDISAGYWPDRTWVINGLLHGQVEWCEKSLELVETLLYTHELKDAYSSYEFPQFMQSESPTSDIKISFKSTNTSFMLADKADVLTVKNVSKKHTMYIKSIESDKISINSQKGFALLPGETKEFTVSACDKCYDVITVKYKESGKAFDTLEKSFGITVLDSYSGVSEDGAAPDNNNAPIIFRYIAMIVDKLLAMFK